MKLREDVAAPSKQEMNELVAWVAEDTAVIPMHMKDSLERLLSVYSNLLKGADRARRTLFHLRQAMGFIPKSEKGGQTPSVRASCPTVTFPDPVPVVLAEMSPENRAQYELIRKKRDECAGQKRDYDRGPSGFRVGWVNFGRKAQRI